MKKYPTVKFKLPAAAPTAVSHMLPPVENYLFRNYCCYYVYAAEAQSVSGS